MSWKQCQLTCSSLHVIMETKNEANLLTESMSVTRTAEILAEHLNPLVSITGVNYNSKYNVAAPSRLALAYESQLPCSKYWSTNKCNHLPVQNKTQSVFVLLLEHWWFVGFFYWLVLFLWGSWKTKSWKTFGLCLHPHGFVYRNRNLTLKHSHSQSDQYPSNQIWR